MGERKVQCKYIPADFDPSKTGRRSKPRNGQHEVRFMLPMSIKCSNCGDYMFQGTKANSHKELAYEQFYLGLPVFRFYIHCKNCYSEIIFRTDPEHSDYIIESGATRHFEPWKKVQMENIEEEKARLQNSAIEVLESETKNKDHELLQTEELERLVTKEHKHKKLKIKDIRKIHQEENDKKKEEDLTAEDLKALESFRPNNSQVPQKPQTIKKTIHVNPSFFSKSPTGLLDYELSD
ncbi:Coiled-coil domain-containing protein 94 [Tritrichomonas musculus]|uniref:Coiled-coil domain-containing protein 94 n=2 Tax=Tritrichomonas musculus TaxID=1915356 RepID=A0ABR2HKB7_9EUKA